MPTIDGQLAYHNLVDWWLSTFTVEEQAYIQEVFQPMGGEGANILTEGTITSSGTTTIQVLTSLVGWFAKPGDRHIAYRILAKAEELSHEPQTFERMHFFYSAMGETCYKDRADPELLARAIAAYEAQVAIAPKVAVEMRRFCRAYGTPVKLPTHIGFKQLAIIREKQKDYAEAIRLCKLAKKQGWDGGWDKRIERYEKKMK